MCMPLCITFYSADLEIWGTCAARWNALCWWRRIGQGQTWWRSLVMSATATFFKHGPWKTQMVIWVEHMVSDAPAMKNMSWENHRAPKTQPWKVDEGGWRWMKLGKKKQRWLKKSLQIAVDFAGARYFGRPFLLSTSGNGFAAAQQATRISQKPEILNWLPVSMENHHF